MKAAPFCHPKLAPIEHGGRVDIGLGARLEAATKRDEEAQERFKSWGLSVVEADDQVFEGLPLNPRLN
jgi:hypothetical protein